MLCRAKRWKLTEECAALDPDRSGLVCFGFRLACFGLSPVWFGFGLAQFGLSSVFGLVSVWSDCVFELWGLICLAVL